VGANVSIKNMHQIHSGQSDFFKLLSLADLVINMQIMVIDLKPLGSIYDFFFTIHSVFCFVFPFVQTQLHGNQHEKNFLWN
jgi:hypothetical protein